MSDAAVQPFRPGSDDDPKIRAHATFASSFQAYVELCDPNGPEGMQRNPTGVSPVPFESQVRTLISAIHARGDMALLEQAKHAGELAAFFFVRARDYAQRWPEDKGRIEAEGRECGANFRQLFRLYGDPQRAGATHQLQLAA